MSLRPILALATGLLVLATMGCGGADDEDQADAAQTGDGAEPTLTRAWALSSEQLCSMLTAEEVSLSLGVMVIAEASSFDGCVYQVSEQLMARLTESPFREEEYGDFVASLGAAETERHEDSVLAVNKDGRVLGAWFVAGGRSLEVVFAQAVPREACAQLLAAARA